jgi:aminomethyltransferase
MAATKRDRIYYHPRRCIESTGEIALQGPASAAILSRLTKEDLSDLGYYWLRQEVTVAGVCCLVSRTGYTGEDGFELYCSADDVVTLWHALLNAGKQDGLISAGLGARDTLRFEACLPLYGHELSPTITPLEAGLKPFVKFDKADFIGRSVLAAQYEAGVSHRIVGLEMVGRGIARAGHICMSEGLAIGVVTSGTFAPTLGKNLALALVNIEFVTLGTPIQVDIRGKQVDAVVIAKPFYRRIRK